MHYVLAACLLLLAGVCITAGVLLILVWRYERRLRRLDADYRAFALLAQARYDMQRTAFKGRKHG